MVIHLKAIKKARSPFKKENLFYMWMSTLVISSNVMPTTIKPYIRHLLNIWTQHATWFYKVAVLLLLIRCCSHCGVLCLFHVLLCIVCVLSSFAIISMGKRELVALLCLFSLCLVIVVVQWLFLTVPWVGLQCVILVFPDHTHLLFNVT